MNTLIRLKPVLLIFATSFWLPSFAQLKAGAEFELNNLSTEINTLKDKLLQQEKLNEDLLNKFITEKQRF